MAQTPTRPQPLNLGAIAAGPIGPDAPDSETRVEEKDLDAQERQLHLTSTQQDIAERRKYAGRVFWLVVFWIAGIFVLLLCEGFSSTTTFHLDDSVLIAAIGGTTINVIGIFIVVARYLFPSAARQPQQARRGHLG